MFKNAFLIILACCGCHVPNENPKIISYDYSVFSNFYFEQHPALGFCPLEESTYKAKIHMINTNTYFYSSSDINLVHRDSINNSNIVYQLSDSLFYVEIGYQERNLLSDEIKRTKSVFSKITLFSDEPDICREMSADPCRIIYTRWDSKQYSDYYCSENRLTSNQVEILIELLDDLKNAN